MSKQVKIGDRIVWDDIGFATSPIEILRACAYHKDKHCAELMAGRGIRRYQTYVNGRKVCDTVACEGCGAVVGKSARRRLEAGGAQRTELFFGPLVKNIRTDYYELPVRTLAEALA